MVLVGFHGVTSGDIVGSFANAELYVSYDQSLAQAYAGNDIVFEVRYTAQRPLVLSTPEAFIEAYEASRVAAIRGMPWHPQLTHRFADWARRQGYDAVCIPSGAFEGELGYEWVASTFGEPQMILLDPSRATLRRVPRDDQQI